MNEKVLDLREHKFQGNVLDLGYRDYGIVYNLCKRDNKELDIEYINKNDKGDLDKEEYDYCVLLFSLKYMLLDYNKKEVFQYIYNHLKEGGQVYIWDVDKGLKKIFNYKIKVVISENNKRIISIKDFNPLNDNSKENIIKLLTEKFDIIDFDYDNDIFFIRAEKKGC